METTTLGFVTEIGTYGSMGIKDPTVVEVSSNGLDDLAKQTKDPALKEYLTENLNKK